MFTENEITRSHIKPTMKVWLMNCRRESLIAIAFKGGNFLAPVDNRESLVAFFKDD
jgi:hypothetical protein